MNAATRINQIRAMLPPDLRERVDAKHKALNPDWYDWESRGCCNSEVRSVPIQMAAPAPKEQPKREIRPTFEKQGPTRVGLQTGKKAALTIGQRGPGQAPVPRGRRAVYANDQERKAAKQQREQERRAAEGWTPQKSGPKPKYSSPEEKLAAKRERARDRYHRDRVAKPVVVKEPRERRKPGPVAVPVVQIPRDVCPHAEEMKRGFAADGRQKWRCKNCGRDRTEGARGPGRPRLGSA